MDTKNTSSAPYDDPDNFPDQNDSEDMPESQKRPVQTVDIDALIQESFELAEEHQETLGGLQALIDERIRLSARQKRWKEKEEARLDIVNKFVNPLEGLLMDAHPDNATVRLLMLQGIIDSDFLKQLKGINKAVGKLSNLPYLPENLREKLQALRVAKHRLLKDAEGRLESKKNAIEERRQSVRKKVLEHHENMITDCSKRISEIDANPVVQEYVETEKREFLDRVQKSVQSLLDRHANVDKKLTELTGDENYFFSLIEAVNGKDRRKAQSIFDKAQRTLIEKIKEGMISHPKDVVPWKSDNNHGAKKYFRAITLLQDEATLERLDGYGEDNLALSVRSILDENEALRRLFGREKPRKINESKILKKSPFWAALEASYNKS